MPDFISRDEFAEHLADIQYGEAPTGRTGENIDYQNGVYAGLDMAYVALKQFPAADVRPVVRGKWIRGRESMTGPGKDRYTCSVCGEKTLSGFCGNPAKTNFCPNCGADMREVKTDD